MNTLPFTNIYESKPIRGVIGTGKQGDKPGEFNHPRKVCYDEWNDRIMVTDGWNHRIQLFNSKTLQLHSMIDSRGQRNGQFSCPVGLCIQPFTRHLLVCDSKNNRIQILDPTDHYSFLYQFGSVNSVESNAKGQFIYPEGICCDEKGHIVVADTYNHRIQEFNESGQFLFLFGSFGFCTDRFCYPQCICYDKEHCQLPIADCGNKRVSIWSHDSSSKPQCISHIQLNDDCYSVCVDPLRNHQILIGTGCNILVYDSRNHKEPIQTLGSNRIGLELGEFYYASSLCINEQDGTLIVADKYNHRIQLF